MLFEQQQEDCCKPKRVSNFCDNNYIEYESNGDRNKNLSLDEYLDKIKSYLRDIIDFQVSDTWKTQITIEINFIFSKDAEENCVIHSKRDKNLRLIIKQIKFLMNSIIHLIQDIKVI